MTYAKRFGLATNSHAEIDTLYLELTLLSARIVKRAMVFGDSSLIIKQARKAKATSKTIMSKMLQRIYAFIFSFDIVDLFNI